MARGRAQGATKVILGGDFKKLKRLLERYPTKFRQATRRAVKKSVLFGLAEVDRQIRAGNYEPLAELTLMARDAEGFGTTPLLKTGALIRAINHDVLNDFTGAVGVKRSSKGGANLAELLHEGATIRVTDAMKRAFMRKFGRNLRGRSTGKTTLRIPPRRFIADVFENPAFILAIRKIFEKELERSLKA